MTFVFAKTIAHSRSLFLITTKRAAIFIYPDVNLKIKAATIDKMLKVAASM